MGADSFIAFYGIKIGVDPTNEAMLDSLDSGSDPRLKAARQVGLHTHWGRMTDGEDYFLYVGHRLGWLGVENDAYVQLTLDKLIEMATGVQARLKEAGFR